MTFTWANGRQLSALTESDGTQISYQYNMDGIRTKKTVGNVTTEYIVSGGMILEEIHEDVTYRYYYNESGAPIAMKVGSGETYFFEKNAQGDIVALFNNSGAEVARISYDAYGNTLYIDNPDNLYIPFRYRGYYYDADTGFYYLQSRYYDPETGRFINADDVDYLGAICYMNLFTYCGNNPILYIDKFGHRSQYPREYYESIYTLSFKEFDDILGLIDDEVYRLQNSWYRKILGIFTNLSIGRVTSSIKYSTAVVSVIEASGLLYSDVDELNTIRYRMDTLRRKSGMDYTFSIFMLNGYSGEEIRIVSYCYRKPIEAIVFQLYWSGNFTKIMNFVERIEPNYHVVMWDWRYTYVK